MVGAIGIAICFGLLASITTVVMGFGVWAALAVYSATGIVVFLFVAAVRVLRPKIEVSHRVATISRSEEAQYKR